MAINYAGLRNTAERLIRENGKIAYVVVEGAPTGPDWDPQPLPDIESAVNFVETGYKIDNRDATLINEGDKLGIVSTETGAAPVIGGAMRIDGILYQMIDVQPLVPGPLVMLYKIHARK